MAEVPALGPRGEGWVVLQFLLMGLVAAACVAGPRWPDSVASALAVAGAVLAVAGGALVFWSARALGRALTPFPRPAAHASCVDHGPYGVVRHPIYAGGALFFAGWSLAFSPLALGITAALVVVWALKITVEERFLRATYPEYEPYCARTRWRLAPFVF